MTGLAKLFDPPAEIIAEYSSDLQGGFRANELDIRDMLKRRPCTIEEICLVFGLHENEASKYMGKLAREGLVRQERKNGGIYFSGLQDKDAKNKLTCVKGKFY